MGRVISEPGQLGHTLDEAMEAVTCEGFARARPGRVSPEADEKIVPHLAETAAFDSGVVVHAHRRP